VAQQISVEITINGNKIAPFSQLSLRQQFNAHHYFELHFNHDVLETSGAVTLDKSKDYLGKSINISFNNFEKTQNESVFKGIVTDIRIANTMDSPGDIIFSGYSSSILLETGESNKSFLNKPLNSIVKEITSAVASNDLKVSVNPVKKSNLPYCVQYLESHFEFLRRLAAEYGEYFYYDGSVLNFGKPSQANSLSLQYPNDLSDLNLQVRLTPMNFKHGGFLSKENKKLSVASSAAQVAGLEAFGKHALSVSDQVFSAKTNTFSNRKFLEQKDLDESVKIVKSTAASNMVVVEASSDSPQVTLGATASIMADTTDYGKFTVIAVNHHTDGLGNYHNHFEAIPSTIAVVPNSHEEKQIAEPQMGYVIDNKDPDKLGKVKVRLLWQEDNESTPFIRVLTPHAGLYKNEKKTRGFFFTPEVDEMVIVGFTQNDPERPFVMGSLPHGKAIDSSESGDDTHIKSLSTRSGNIMTFSDEVDNKQSINIQTDDKNYISIEIDNMDGMIKIYSSKAIEVNSQETIVVKSGKSIDIQGDKTINIKSEKITIEATDTVSISANKKIELKAADISIEADSGLEAKGGSSVKVEGASAEFSGTGSAKLKGAMVNVEASGINTIKGSMVMIN